ncbi:unnamed protein product [Rhizophagus irregularis]|uniref:Tc1-like transposase DDE domain-containing protein n=1 Tax=Rhizophagus irregularis TaxID=588596 RepID=A0A916ED01_9GLOM|nr:unnamed protein product [Rhizophagus irregularis]
MRKVLSIELLHFTKYWNRKIRLEWALTGKKNGILLWSDESRFEVFGGDGRDYVWRKPEEKYNVDCLVPSRKGVMVWGYFSSFGMVPLVQVHGRENANDYINVLNNHLLPYLEGLDNQNDYIFQDDNAQIYRARSTLRWISDNNTDQLPWPAQSSDLNSIEIFGMN